MNRCTTEEAQDEGEQPEGAADAVAKLRPVHDVETSKRYLKSKGLYPMAYNSRARAMYYIYSNHTMLIMNYICYHVM